MRYFHCWIGDVCDTLVLWWKWQVLRTPSCNVWVLMGSDLHCCQSDDAPHTQGDRASGGAIRRPMRQTTFHRRCFICSRRPGWSYDAVTGAYGAGLKLDTQLRTIMLTSNNNLYNNNNLLYFNRQSSRPSAPLCWMLWYVCTHGYTLHAGQIKSELQSNTFQIRKEFEWFTLYIHNIFSEPVN